MTNLNILLADDHAIIRLGMKFLLDSQFNNSAVDEVEDCRGLLEMLRKKIYSHLILDLQLQDCNVINIFSGIRREFPDLHILIYTMSPEEIFGKRLLQMGASGFLSKQSHETEVNKALRIFLLGRRYVSDILKEQIRRESESAAKGQNPFIDLSDREMAVAHNLLQGKGVKEIAGELNLKSTTVATYKARIFDKMGVNNMSELHSVARMYQFHP